MTTHIVAMGGGGFSMSEDHRATDLDRYLLSLTDVANPMVCFIPTASADDGLYVSRFINAYSQMGTRTSVLTLWSGARDAVARMSEVDVFLIGGGNTVNLLALWRAHGVGKQLSDIAAASDVVIGGIAAGAAALFEGCSTDGFGGGVAPLPYGLGLARGSFCPHYSSEPQRAPLFGEFIDRGQLPAGWGVDDGAAVHLVDGKVEGFLGERDEAGVYHVELEENGPLVTPQDTRRLWP